MTGHEPRTTGAILFHRVLPGGGYVAIDRDTDVPDGETPRVRVWLERRSADARRDGHSPPIIAEIVGDEHSPEFAELYRLANDNAALARALMNL